MCHVQVRSHTTGCGRVAFRVRRVDVHQICWSCAILCGPTEWLLSIRAIKNNSLKIEIKISAINYKLCYQMSELYSRVIWFFYSPWTLLINLVHSNTIQHHFICFEQKCISQKRRWQILNMPTIYILFKKQLHSLQLHSKAVCPYAFYHARNDLRTEYISSVL